MPKVDEAHVAARRLQIIEAACECWSRNGVRKTTIREIAREAGLSTGAIYVHFDGKQEIVEAAAKIGRQSTRSLLESAPTSDEAPRSIEEMVGKVIEVLASDDARSAARVDLRLWAEALDAPRIHELFEEAFANLRAPLSATVRRGQERGEIDDRIDPEAAARVLAALGIGFEVQKAIDPAQDFAGCREVVAALLDGTFTRQEGRP